MLLVGLSPLLDRVCFSNGGYLRQHNFSRQIPSMQKAADWPTLTRAPPSGDRRSGDRQARLQQLRRVVNTLARFPRSTKPPGGARNPERTTADAPQRRADLVLTNSKETVALQADQAFEADDGGD